MKKRLDQLLVDLGLADSRRQAQTLIMTGNVFIEGQRRDKAGWRVDEDADIEVKQTDRYVSRAALKLESVAKKLKADLKGKVVLDVGSSTGGFTDYALQNGATQVIAVDVGTGQLHYRLRQDPKVVVMEKTDIRDVEELPKKPDIAVVDVSFISLRLVLPQVSKLIKPNGRILAMAKPQFEAGRADASKHKGVIKNDRLRRQILKDLEQWLKQHFVVIDKADSALSGAKGNVERFFLLKNKK